MSLMHLTDVLRGRRPAAGSSGEALAVPPHTRSPMSWREFLRFSEQLRKELSEPDWRRLGQFYQDVTYEDLVTMLDMPMEQVKAMETRLRWKLRRFVQCHGYEHTDNPLIQGFLDRTFRSLRR